MVATTKELLVELGAQLRAQRLRENLSLEEVARTSGMSINAVRRLETGQGSTLASFVSMLKVLQRENWHATLRPVVTVSPMDMVLRRGKQRLRAYKRRVSDKAEISND